MSRARDFADLAGSADAGGLTGRNLIINGAMNVAQRATGATAIGSGYYTVDRFQTSKSNDGAFTNEQSTDHPNGSGNSLKWAVTTADTSVAAGQFLYFGQKIEGQNLQHLLYGTSSAKSLTLSFWVKSNKTGTYTIFVRKLDNTAYHFVHEYTISSADTWEKKEITISPTAGSTSFITASAGAIDNDTGSGMMIGWNLAFGSTYNGATNNAWSSNTNHYATSNQVNWMDSTSNNFYLTEVQLEVGEKATPFEHRSFIDEQQKCFRYYYDAKKANADQGNSYYYAPLHRYDSHSKGTTWEFATAQHPVRMRTAPTITLIDGSGNTGKISHWTTGGGNQTHNHNAYTTNAKEMNVTISDYSTSGIYGFYAAYIADAEL